jgi:hypothetical protein
MVHPTCLKARVNELVLRAANAGFDSDPMASKAQTATILRRWQISPIIGLRSWIVPGQKLTAFFILR